MVAADVNIFDRVPDHFEHILLSALLVPDPAQFQALPDQSAEFPLEKERHFESLADACAANHPVFALVTLLRPAPAHCSAQVPPWKTTPLDLSDLEHCAESFS